MQIGAIQPGGAMIAPAGWCVFNDDPSLENHDSSLENHDSSLENHDFCDRSTGSGGHVMLLVLTRSLKELDKYSFAIVNTGEGLE